MRSAYLGLTAVLAFAGCTTGDDDGLTLPDADIRIDGGMMDGGRVDARLPDPIEETCTPERMGSTLGQPCETITDCDDGCYCNGVEACGTGGTCVAGADPCADEVECTEEACLEETNTCYRQPRHAMCEDADACNGAEVCDTTRGCQPAAPLYCNDENSCTVDACDTAMGCTFTLRDLDMDGYVDGRCGGDDCDDDPRFGTDIFPGATEVCDNRRDDDCDGMRDFNDMADCTPTNDRCDSAVVLPGAGTYSGSTVGLRHDYNLGCATGLASAPDAIFRFTLTEPHDVRVTVAGGGGSPHGGPSPAVALRPFAMCAAGPDDKCSQGMPPSFLRRSLPAGDYAIIVQTPSAATFDLTLMITAPTPIPPIDRCDPSTSMDVSAGGTFRGMFMETEDDYRLSCNSPGGGMGFRDAAYRFTIPAGMTKDLRATLNVSGTAMMWVTPQPRLALTRDCTMTTAEMGCATATPALIMRRGLTEGTYYLLVEGTLTDTTDYTLDVALTDPAMRRPGDACITNLDITDRTQTVDWTMMEFDSGVACGGTAMTNRDAYFYFDLADTRDVTVTATSTGGGTLWMSVNGTGCAAPGDIRCNSGASPRTQFFRSLPAGRYYVAVATASAFGSLMVSATTAPPTPIPPNDRCMGAIETYPSYSRVDTLIGFADDLMGCSGTGLVDAFYRLTLPSPKIVNISATRTTGTAPLYLTVRNVCGAGSNLYCHSGHPASIAPVMPLAAGTYYIMVESTEAFASDLRLTVTTFDP